MQRASVRGRWGSGLTERQAVWLLVLAGIVLRLVLLVVTGRLVPLNHESDRIAVALATRGEFADAFGPGTGPTAHVGYLVVAIPAAVYRLFGPHTPTAEFVLATLCIVAVSLSFKLLHDAFADLGMTPTARLAALAFLCLVTMHLDLEVKELRVWETGYAALALAAMLRGCVRLDRVGLVSLPVQAGLGVAIGAIAVLSPSVGLGCAPLVGLLLLRRVRWTHWPIAVIAAAVTYLALTIPWAIRNEHALGAPISSRSSAGIGLAISSYEGVLDKPSEQAAYADRFREVSPAHISGVGLARMRAAGGEAAYGRQLKAEAFAWIRQHPDQAAQVWLRNLKNYYMPPVWFWSRFLGRYTVGLYARSYLLSAIGLGGLVTLAWLMWRRQWRFLFVAAAILPPALPYIIVYPLLRYRYPVSSILLFLAVLGLSLAIRRIKGPSGRGAIAA